MILFQDLSVCVCVCVCVCVQITKTPKGRDLGERVRHFNMNIEMTPTASHFQKYQHPVGKWSLSSTYSAVSLQSLPVPGCPRSLWSGGERGVTR